MRKWGIILCMMILGGFTTSCYESPSPAISEGLDGIWISERYEDLVDLNSPRILMMEIEGDKITIFYNVQNAAFRYTFSSNEETLFITSEAVLPDSRVSAINLSDDGVLEITGPLFGIGQDYIRASISELEAYKYEFLINEFGRWRGAKYGIFFELAPDRVSEFIWDGESFGVTVTEVDGKDYIRAIDSRNRVQFWEYVVKRNSLIVGFDEGVGEFERVNTDNIYILD